MELVYLHPIALGERGPKGVSAVGAPSFPLIPMGVVGLCNSMRAHGHGVRGLNIAVERMLDPGFRSASWLATNPPADLVLIDLHWHEHILGALELAQRVGQAWPRARIVLGGLTASAFAVELLSLVSAVDAVILGDAEQPLLAFVAALASGSPWPFDGVCNLITRRSTSPPRWVAGSNDLDRLEHVDLGFLEHAEAYRRLIHSHPRRPHASATVGATGHWLSNGRGCVRDCASCGGGLAAHRVLAGRRGPVWRDPRAVAADLVRLRDTGVQQVALGLDPDMAGAAHRDACLGDPQGLGLYLESFQLPSTGLLDRLTRGCDPDHSELAITALSGDPGLRRRHGKGFGDPELLAALDALVERGLSASLFFSMGLPGESGAAFEATLGLAQRVLDRDRHGLLRLAALPLALDPCAPMGLSPEAWGLEPTDAGDLAARLARGRGLADGSIHPLSPRALGYTVPGCDLPQRAARWNALAVEAPEGAVIPVPGI